MNVHLQEVRRRIRGAQDRVQAAELESHDAQLNLAHIRRNAADHLVQSRVATDYDDARNLLERPTPVAPDTAQARLDQAAAGLSYLLGALGIAVAEDGHR